MSPGGSIGGAVIGSAQTSGTGVDCTLADAICVSAGFIQSEGTTADASEFQMVFAEHTADRVLTIIAATNVTLNLDSGNFVFLDPIDAASMLLTDSSGSNTATTTGGNHTANRTNTVTAGTNWVQDLDSGGFAFSDIIYTVAGALGITTTGDPDTGIWFDGSGDVFRLRAGGADTAQITATAFQVTDATFAAQDASSNSYFFVISNTSAGSGVGVRKTITAAGTTGAQTISRPGGRVNFAAAASTLVVTNTLVNTTASQVFLTATRMDATCTSFAATTASGSFTITANAACTSETGVEFLVVN